ncbi:D-alanyl-D-alanine carboxypeptidase family protein [Pannonibacter tanglangensis]|uniref:serine-type D-Ala-D-Ala carboxypeptidase n=1 Tax=Pannonibacter tanglangensis TaxID=2750084 RepID=A0ABW9ZBF0_9HYPH|nr:D-alanyl-D-alanine carboxypeptidase family protein [Pannonibacter sp. XCT-34]NBN62149.1 D-alanyl-D-alanine carboxypeptidase [Pannonibacter sp. XCT-34]
MSLWELTGRAWSGVVSSLCGFRRAETRRRRRAPVRLVLSLLLTLSLGVALSLAIAPACSPARAEAIETRAPIAFLYDITADTLLYAKEADKPFAPGSLAKVMTAVVVFDALAKGEISADTLYTVSEHAWRTGGAPSHGATMFAAVKSQIAVKDLLAGLIVHNANDAAIVLAEGLAGSEAAFAERMTRFGLEIGLTGSRFRSPTGLDADASTVTARDMVTLGRHLLERHADRLALFTQADFTWNNIFQRNKNRFLGEIRGLDGLAGGQSERDGFSGLITVEREGRRIVGVLAGLPNDKARLQALKELADAAWESFATQTLFVAGAAVGEARVFGGVATSVPLVAGRDIAVLLPVGASMNYRLRLVYRGPLIAPVTPGTEVGELRVIGPDDVVVYKAPVVTGGAVETGTLRQRAVNGVTELLFGWM